MSPLAIAGISLRRVGRDRTALFFLVVLPVLVILVVGASVSGFSTFRVGVVDQGAGPAGRSLVAALARAPDLDVRTEPSVAAARTAVARADLSTAVVLPAGMDAALAAGRSVDVVVLAEPTNSTQQAAAAAVGAVVARQGSLVQAARFATEHVGGSTEGNLARARATAGQVAQVDVSTRVVDAAATILPQGYAYSAPTMLVLFVFLNALAAGATVVETRRLGMYERMAAAPVRTASVVAGETLGALSVTLAQSVLIVVVGALAFGVSWGDPVGVAALLVAWALVSAGAGMLSGTLFRTPEQASAIGPAVGIAFAMLGGCMWPLAIVSPVLREVGHVTPQAWAVDAWTALVARGVPVSGIAPELGVLAAFAVGFWALAAVRLRRWFT